jgi:hypothetical protein
MVSPRRPIGAKDDAGVCSGGRGGESRSEPAEATFATSKIVDIPIEIRWCRRDDAELGNKQFWVADPDGYVLRFFSDLGRRPVPA